MNKNDNIYLTHQRKQISDLDSLPLVDRSLVDYEKYHRFIGQAMVTDCMYLQGTRGCPFKCAYCHKIWPKTHFVRSAENLFTEVQLYYRMGVKRFSFVDDIFNFDVKNSTRFFRLLIKNGMKVELFFPNGLRGDILAKDYIDLMVEAGTVNIAFALETGSPRIQKLIKKNLNIEKLREIMKYTCEKYPEIIIELQTMHGFPSETEEEAMMTLDFIFGLKWLDFPYINVLKIYPNTDMEKIALENGVSRECIANSPDVAYDELPKTLPFAKDFSYKYQAKFLHEYFLLKERLLSVLPYQMKLFSEDDLLQKYNSYLPGHYDSFSAILELAGIDKSELDDVECLPEDSHFVPDLNDKIKEHFPAKMPEEDALRILLLDLSLFFKDGRDILYDVVEPPLGLMCLLTYLESQLGNRINGKIAQSRVGFEDYNELKALIDGFRPDVIGIRTLTLFKSFFHEAVSMIRQWGIDVPIITGGPYATSDYSEILQDSNVDIIVLGEGEISFYELMKEFIENNKKLPAKEVLSKINGIAYVPDRISATGFYKEGPERLPEKKKALILSQFYEDLENE